MNNPLNGADFDRWYVVWLFISVGALFVSIVAKRNDLALIAIGSVLFGMGELKNHPRRETHFPGGKLTSRTRSPSLFGLLLDAGGIGLAVFGIYKTAVVA